MNLKTMNDTNLIAKTESLVREERVLLTTVLRHLHEINRRRLYSSMGYKSLFDFAVRHLGYPEDQAYRRIAAMKLIQEVPEIEKKMNAGEISLTHIGLAQSLFRQEKKMANEFSHEQKLSVFDQIANKPVREAERITLSLSSAPELAKPDRVNTVSENLVELKFTASIELRKKVESLKGLLAHQHPNLSLGELFEQLCDLGLSEWNPGKIAAPRKCRVTQKPSQAQILRGVFQRANTQCENCSSVYALEIDHVVPQAKGGNSEVENLRILCRSCNQRSAIKEFGAKKMEQYLN
ncbi:MAG: hypothetical protein COT73_11225 [Bdellovibrio sp. CG10_big_fil_rev_8_21_14_0_10_47_8]|nr:MAG: hypothetical protein COT73_11225 [Bdellovibrio sp. CG10_big_fil_rev_8_21_14_0_10_47_8]